MLALGLTPLVHTGFQLTPRLESDGLIVNFSGNGDMSAVDALGRYLKQVHQEAVSLEVKDVSFDFRDLYFMNSSCLKAFVSWIYKVNTTGRPYQIHLQMNPRQPWQRRSLELRGVDDHVQAR